MQKRTKFKDRIPLAFAALLVLISILSILSILTLIGPTWPVYTPRTKPNENLLATATYLIEDPVPTQVGPLRIWVDPKPGSAVTVLQQVSFFVSRAQCIGAESQELCNSDTVVTVDGQAFEPAPGSIVGATFESKFIINLSVGLHLFELSLVASSGEVYSYSWTWIVRSWWSNDEGTQPPTIPFPNSPPPTTEGRHP